jgi:hypothetical protein
MAPRRLKRYFPLLRAIAKIKDRKAQALILKQLTKHKPFVVLLREIAQNIIEQNIELTATDKKRLNKHSEVIRGLTKKKKVHQSGGFLGVIVPLLAASIAGLVRDHV